MTTSQLESSSSHVHESMPELKCPHWNPQPRTELPETEPQMPLPWNPQTPINHVLAMTLKQPLPIPGPQNSKPSQDSTPSLQANHCYLRTPKLPPTVSIQGHTQTLPIPGPQDPEQMAKLNPKSSGNDHFLRILTPPATVSTQRCQNSNQPGPPQDPNQELNPTSPHWSTTSQPGVLRLPCPHKDLGAQNKPCPPQDPKTKNKLGQF